jgi:DNA processing protein
MNASDDERLARATLCAIAEPGDGLLGALIARVGAVGAVEVARRGRPPADVVTDEKARLAEHVASWHVRLATAEPAADLARCEDLGGRMVCPGDPSWPSQLDDLGYQAPYALWLRGPGDLARGCQRAVAVVGARVATSYGLRVAADLAAELAAGGWSVVSGGAVGIDAAAHQGAHAVGGDTLTVLGSGVDAPYPSSNGSLFAEMSMWGLLVSESPPGTDPTRLRFVLRQRVIAALTCGTVIVEAAARSGALKAAQYARDLGRVVMAVPGPVTSRTSVGCHALMRQHPPARCVTSAADVISDLTGT